MRAKRLGFLRGDGRQYTTTPRERPSSRSKRASLSVILFGTGLVLLVPSIGGWLLELPLQLFASLAIISLALGLRVAGGSPSASVRDPA